jgi:hypothetical protein
VAARGASAAASDAGDRISFMVVNLDTPAQIAELMYVLTWFTAEAHFHADHADGEAIANAKKIIGPPK